MARVHELAEEALRIVKANGFDPVTWENFPAKMMMVVTEASEARDACYMPGATELGEELADAAIRLLGVLGTLSPGWPSRVENDRHEGTRYRSPEVHMWPMVKMACEAVEHWRHGNRKDSLISTELALLEVYRAANRLGVDLDLEIVRKNAKNAKRGYLHGKKESVG